MWDVPFLTEWLTLAGCDSENNQTIHILGETLLQPRRRQTLILVMVLDLSCIPSARFRRVYHLTGLWIVAATYMKSFALTKQRNFLQAIGSQEGAIKRLAHALHVIWSDASHKRIRRIVVTLDCG